MLLIFGHRGIVAESAAAAMVAAAKIQGAGLATIGLAGAGKSFSNIRSSVRTRY
jgi:F-type H+-transporting ATPase subunit c